MGALPESQIRQFVNRLGKMGGLAEQIASALAMARAAVAQKEYDAALDITGQILQADPTQVEAYALQAQALMDTNQLEAATATLAAVPADKLNDPLIVSARASLDLLMNPVDTSGLATLEGKVAAIPPTSMPALNSRYFIMVRAAAPMPPIS